MKQNIVPQQRKGSQREGKWGLLRLSIASPCFSLGRPHTWWSPAPPARGQPAGILVERVRAGNNREGKGRERRCAKVSQKSFGKREIRGRAMYVAVSETRWPLLTASWYLVVTFAPDCDRRGDKVVHFLVWCPPGGEERHNTGP